MEENDFVDFRNVKLEDKFFSEKELTERLSIDRKDGTISYNLFQNLIQRPIGDREFQKYKGFYIKFETLRQDLGFSKGEKPGDFDILLIPYSKANIFFERTCAIEVKVVRPKRNNPKKAPNSYGITQINGLIKDGFPLVGLIHICMTEPLEENEKSIVKYDLTPFDMDDTYNNKDFLKNLVDVKHDNFSHFSAVTQMKKLLSKEILKYVGIYTVGVNKEIGGGLVTWFDHDFINRYCSGYFNPNKKDQTIERIKGYFEKNRHKFKDAKI